MIDIHNVRRLILVSVIFVFSVNSCFVFAEDLGDGFTTSENATKSVEAPIDINGVSTIDLSNARDLYFEGAVFVDVRPDKDWRFGRISGAVHLDFKKELFVLYSSDIIDKNTPLVFYCNSPLEFRGAMASFFAVKWGYTNVHYFRQGYFAWMAADFPLEYDVAFLNQY